MTSTEMIKEIDTKMEITQKDAEKFIKILAETVHKKVNAGEKVVIKDIVSIDSKIKKAHKARNPKTSEIVDVPEKTVPIVKATTALKDAVK